MADFMWQNVTIVLPAKNEAENLTTLLPKLKALYPESRVLVVDDGSTDTTKGVCAQHNVDVVHHPSSMGNGAAIKSGARLVDSEIIVFMDADGQHKPDDIRHLLERLEEGYDMVVGARQPGSQASIFRHLANRIYNWAASWMVGQKIEDLTSGFRAVRTAKFKEFLYMLPNGFSYPTTITMAFFRTGYPVCYVPIHAEKRQGKSHIRLLRDGMRFSLIILRVGSLYSPFKLFLPVSLSFFLMGVGYYSYTFISDGRFTNMSALLLSTSVIIFMIGIVSEQITNLIYKRD